MSNVYGTNIFKIKKDVENLKKMPDQPEYLLYPRVKNHRNAQALFPRPKLEMLCSQIFQANFFCLSRFSPRVDEI